MTEKINLKEIEKKAFRDSQQDGLMEIMIGAFLFAIAGYLGTGDFILFILLIIFSAPFLQGIRSRFTYPRIGYVKLHQEKPKETLWSIFLYMVVVVLTMAIAFFLIDDVWNPGLWYKWSPAFFGTMMVGAFVYAASKSGSLRYYIFAAMSVAGGFAASVIDFGTIGKGLEMFFLGMSGVLIITGLVLFIRFLRMYPLPAEEGADDKQ